TVAAVAATVLSAGLAPAQAATQAATRQITLCLSEDVRGAETAPHRFGRPEAVRRAWNEWEGRAVERLRAQVAQTYGVRNVAVTPGERTGPRTQAVVHRNTLRPQAGGLAPDCSRNARGVACVVKASPCAKIALTRAPRIGKQPFRVRLHRDVTGAAYAPAVLGRDEALRRARIEWRQKARAELVEKAQRKTGVRRLTVARGTLRPQPHQTNAVCRRVGPFQRCEISARPTALIERY
ncbi:MAG: hypothetical protein AAFW46_14815, partial [Pseudomonadota bacterium]